MSISVDNNVKNQKTTPALYSDVYANIPAFGQTGRLFFATDTNTIYRDTGSAWVVFIAEFTGAGYVTLGTGQTITGFKYFTGGVQFDTTAVVFNTPTSFNLYTTQFNQAITLKNNTGFTSAAGYMSIEAQDSSQSLHLYNGSLNLDYYLAFGTANTRATFPTGTYTVGTGNGTVTGTGTINNIAKFSAAGNIADSTITDSGTVVATTSSVRIGTTPGTTYKLEVDGGINVATGHEYRKNAVAIFNTTNNTVPKYQSSTGTYTNSNITDSGTVVQWNVQTGIGPLSSAGVSLDVNSAISFTTNYVGIKSATIIGAAATSVSYFQSVASTTTGGTVTNLNHYTATQGTYTAAVTNQYGFKVDSTMIGATNDYGFYSDLASATGTFNFYANGTAPSYFGGRVLCNLTSVPTGTSMTSNNLNIYNSFGLQNNDWSAGTAGTAMLFSLTATSGSTSGNIAVRTAGGTGSGVLILNSGGGTVAIGTVATPAYNLQLGADSAAKPSTSTWTIASDSRVKTNITPYTKGLAEIMQINPIEYKYNGKAGFDADTGGIGIIAQDIQTILPETVNTYFAKLNEKDKKDTELLNFNSHALTFVLINAIKELKAEIDLLKLN
jgi:hypothetical protein